MFPSIRNFIAWFFKNDYWVRLLLIFTATVALVTLILAFYASLLPPHLVQEYDVLNYHLTIPRQHLLTGSFAHIPWSTADLFFLPIDFALAPFCLSTLLPNKIPQFFFFIGLLFICGRLAWRFSSGRIWPLVLIVFALMGSHNIGIQLGTAMFGLAICYLFLAALDSFMNGSILLGVIEACFYFWSKPLIPLQFTVTLIIFISFCYILRLFGFRDNVWFFPGEKGTFFKGWSKGTIKKTFVLFLIVSCFVAGPFIFKSIRYSGTPCFPLAVGVLRNFSVQQNQSRWADLEFKANQLLEIKDQYGTGRGLHEFIRHFWLIAVPEKGVTNRYDYPLGLVYLLFLGPFLYLLFSSIKKKAILLFPLWIISSWAVWWFGTQQARFLFIPLVLMYLVVVVSLSNLPSRILLLAIFIAVLLVNISLYRAHKEDLGRWGYSVLRQKDINILSLNKACISSGRLKLPFYDVAYAACPVDVIENDDSVFILETSSLKN